MPVVGKRKLTLTVDNEVVEKAKEIGLNLSEITEKVLRGFAFAPTEGDEAVVYAKYRELFATMLPLLKRYDIPWLAIGEDWVDDEYGSKYTLAEFFLDPKGGISDEGDNHESDVTSLPLTCLYEPKKILANFIDALSSAKQKWIEKASELEMAKRVILAITEELTPKVSEAKGPKS